MGRHAHKPFRPAGDLQIYGGDAHHLAEAEGRHGQKYAPQTQYRHSEQKSHQRSHQRTRQERHHIWNAKPGGENSCRVAANPCKCSIAERQLTCGKRHIKAQGQQSIDPDEVDKTAVNREEI